MRIFQTLLAFSGNAQPQLAITRRLIEHGHEVRVLAHEAARARVEAALGVLDGLVDPPVDEGVWTLRGLLDAARSGPVRAQAADVVELLSDPTRSQVVLVTLPEEMPVTEVVEAAFALEDRIGVTLGPVVVNGCLPADPRLQEDPRQAARQLGVTLDDRQAQALQAAADFREHRRALQEEQLQRLAQELPLPQLRTPFLFEPSVGPPELAALAGALADGVAALGARR